jgi:DNA-binding SARP family transcriptional activator
MTFGGGGTNVNEEQFSSVGTPPAATSLLEFLILGPIDARRGQESIPLSGARRRALVARLLVAGGRSVSGDRLIEDVWDGNPTAASHATLRSHISQLRKALGDRLVATGAGYRLDLDAALVDAAEFERCVLDGSNHLAAGDASEARLLFDRALALWRGPALAEVADRPWAQPEAARLEELQAAAVEDAISARLATGEHEVVVALAEAAVADEPLREQRWGHLMLALYRCGRQADALRAYQRLRGVLADELGINPSPPLTALEMRILQQDASLLDWAPAIDAPEPPPPAASLMDQARQASSNGQWREVYDLLCVADAAHTLGAEELEWLGDMAFVVGSHDVSISARQRAFAAWVSAGHARRSAVPALMLVANHYVCHRPAVAGGWFQRARRILDGEPEGPEHALLACNAALLAMATGDNDATLVSARMAEAIGRRFGVHDVATLALALQGAALLRLGDITDGLERLDEALACTVASEIGPVAAGLVICRGLQALLDVGDLQRALEWVDSVATCGTGGQSGGYPGDCRIHLAEALAALGRWREADKTARTAIDEIQDFDLTHVGVAHAVIGHARLARQDLAGAEASFVRAHTCGASPQPGLALLYLARGDKDAAGASIESALADTTVDAASRGRLLAAAVDIAVARGDTIAAKRGYDQLDDLARRYGTGWLRGAAVQAHGVVALMSGDATGAVADLRMAWRIFEEIGATGHVGAARLRLAEALDTFGDHGGAEMERAAARAIRS